MEVDVTFLSRRGTAVMRRSQRASADRIGIGRGTDNQVRLTDIHVGLHVAVLTAAGDRMALERLDNAPIEVNGTVADSALLNIGDKITIGPYQIEVMPPPEGCDGAIQIEVMQAAAEAEADAQVRIGLERTGASKRIYAWGGFLVVLIVFLAIPVVFLSGGLIAPWKKDTVNPVGPQLVGLAWNTGSFSSAHRFIGADCSTCHNGGAFHTVKDNACLACHTTIANHVAHGTNVGSLAGDVAGMRCVDCHTEHRGIEGSVIRTDNLCTDCHRTIKEAAPAAGVNDVTGFPNGHPQFRATLVASATRDDKGEPVFKTVRAELGTNPPPMDHPGIKFSHKAHLDTVGKKALGDRAVKDCADCHIPDPGGMGFTAITYKDNCERCHELTFDSVTLPWPNAKVPHGDDVGVIAAVWNYYAGAALQGGLTPPAPSPLPERQGAGIAPPPMPAANPPGGGTLATVTAKTATALRVVFDDKRGCAYCHYGVGADGAFDTEKILADALPPKANPPHVVAPVMLRTRFLPPAEFNHAFHRAMECADCHASKTSESSGDVLIPGVETCVKCHGNENASLATPSNCISCHVFHRTEFGLMQTTSAGMTQ